MRDRRKNFEIACYVPQQLIWAYLRDAKSILKVQDVGILILKLEESDHSNYIWAYLEDVISIWKLQKFGLLIFILYEVDHPM